MRFLALFIAVGSAVVALAAEPPSAAVSEWSAELHSEVARVRVRAAAALGKSADPAAVAPLIGALQDAEAGVRREAARGLGALRAANAGPALVQALQDADLNVRFYAASALGELRDAAAADALIEVLLGDVDPGVRGQAAWALNALRPPGVAEPLLAGLRRNTADVRQIAWLLKQLDDPRALTGLQALAQDREARLGRRALEALGDFGGDVARIAGMAALNDGDTAVRLAAVGILAQHRSRQVIEALNARLEHEPDPAVRDAIQTLVAGTPARGALIAHWSFDDRSATRAREVTGHGPEGELKGATVAEGRIGAALRFAGGVHVALGKPDGQPIQDTPFTVMAWARPEAPTGVVVARGGAFCGYALYVKEGRPAFGIHRQRDGPAHIAAGGEPLADGWTHLAGVVDTGAIRLYVDGRLAAEATTPGLIPTAPGQGMEIGIDLGTSPAEITDGFTGVIDEVKVFHGTLSATEIAKAATGQ
jgi:HEAT repeat protein